MRIVPSLLDVDFRHALEEKHEPLIILEKRIEKTFVENFQMFNKVVFGANLLIAFHPNSRFKWFFTASASSYVIVVIFDRVVFQ